MERKTKERGRLYLDKKRVKIALTEVLVKRQEKGWTFIKKMP